MEFYVLQYLSEICMSSITKMHSLFLYADHSYLLNDSLKENISLVGLVSALPMGFRNFPEPPILRLTKTSRASGRLKSFPRLFFPMAQLVDLIAPEHVTMAITFVLVLFKHL